MLRWVTQFIKENQDSWEDERKEKEKIANEKLEQWKKMKRFEKINHLKKRWENKEKENNKNNTSNTNNINNMNTDENWKVWRKKRKINEIEAGFDIIPNFTENQNDQMQVQTHYDMSKVLKKN